MAVPSPAPATPRLKPGKKILAPKSEMYLEGKISRKLKKTLRNHPTTFKMLGVLIFPLHWSIPEATPPRFVMGSDMAKIAK